MILNKLSLNQIQSKAPSTLKVVNDLYFIEYIENEILFMYDLSRSKMYYLVNDFL